MLDASQHPGREITIAHAGGLCQRRDLRERKAPWAVAARGGSAIRLAAERQGFLPAGGTVLPPPANDFLYSDIELFGLSDFGFLASLLLRI